MAQSITDLDAALDAYEKAESASIDEINTAVQAIVAKVGPGVDVTAEVARIQAAQQKLSQAADAIKAQAPPAPTPAPTPAP